MSRNLVLSLGLVGVVAALKTFLVYSLALSEASTGPVLLSGLFALFYVLTALVAYVTYTQLKGYLQRQRRDKLVAGEGEPIAKETVILKHAADWGLSQAEADVAIFVAKGFSNSEIAEMRGSAITTVKSQLGRIYHKSGLESRYQLIAFVTDEVCDMAKVTKTADAKIATQNVLPLNGRSKVSA